MSDDRDTRKTAARITRREALKRMARTSGQIGLVVALPSWVVADSLFGKSGAEEDERQAYYYSWYSRYASYYASYSSYGYSSYSYYSYSGSYLSYFSYGGYGDSPGATCFIDTLSKKKK